jgi:hypothetical protein
MGKLALRAVLAVAAIAALVPALALARTPSRCGLVSFAHQTSDGAFQIAARDTTCSTARVVAGDSRPSRFRSGDPRYTALGFSCAGHGRQLGGHGMQVVVFQCVRERSLVSFVRA